MMGLGNGRRGMKSPPLLVAALVACVIVLGFNYWIASSRSLDLQSRIMDLEGRVRRAAAERGAVELKKNEFQGELEKQREQIDKIQSTHNFQMENVNRLYRDEKASLMNNITTSERLIQNLQEHFKDLQKNYSKIQQEVLQFQKNQTNLERKFSYDLSQCISQMKELKEQCEERIEEVTKKGGDAPGTKVPKEKEQQNIQSEPGPHDPVLPKGEKSLGIPAEGSRPSVPGTEKAPVIRSLGDGEGTHSVLTVSREGNQEAPLPLDPQELGREQASYKEEKNGGEPGGLAPGLPDKAPVGPESPGDEEPEREQLINDEGQQDGAGEGYNPHKREADADYNMDGNEAESETEKQAALADPEDAGKDPNPEDQNRDNTDNNLFDLHDKENPTL
ncbi:Golgi membrane protein 1 [Tachyglossus aculeatus]|uniref:Golgi membrane protein 1 n=1 Tax=Tachyglossus aculeatus TaxID=9261 RepID=UPI0018F28F7E|nr:Golgi membrane protein 1 [Tachyglossus aculeatus]